MKTLLIILTLMVSINTYAADSIVVLKVYEDSAHICFAPTWKKEIADVKTPVSCVAKPSEESQQKLALEIELLKLQITQEKKKKLGKPF